MTERKEYTEIEIARIINLYRGLERAYSATIHSGNEDTRKDSARLILEKILPEIRTRVPLSVRRMSSINEIEAECRNVLTRRN